MFVAIVSFPGFDIINFESFFPTWEKSQDKNLNIMRMKKALKVK